MNIWKGENMDIKSWYKYYGKPLSVMNHRSKAVNCVPSVLQSIAEKADKTLLVFCDNDIWEAWVEEEHDPSIVGTGTDPWLACIELLLKNQSKYGFNLGSIFMEEKAA